MRNHDDANQGAQDSAEPARKPVPLAMARGPFEYIPGEQEGPVQLANTADMLNWAKKLGPFAFGMASWVWVGLLCH